MVLVFRHLFRKNYVGLTLWPFIIVKEQEYKEDTVLINHERIHLKQQMELLIIPFYILYVGEWLFRSLLYMDSYRAYQNISFEREAYGHEKDLGYTNHRRPFAFLQYIFRS